jgi:hypothetical protein
MSMTRTSLSDCEEAYLMYRLKQQLRFVEDKTLYQYLKWTYMQLCNYEH